MAILTGTMVVSGLEVEINIPTIRIPELPEADLPFDALDKIPIYDNSQNKTAWVGADGFLAYLSGAGATPITPVTNGSVVEITITPAMAGSYQVNVPALAGFTFLLERRGQGPLKTSEYSILPSGGFELTDHTDLVQEGEVFFAKVFEFMAPVDPATLDSLLNGMAVISSNTTLSSIHYNKLIHISGFSSKLVITLPDIADAPDNLVIIFETTINNDFKTKIIGNSGQVIYFGGSSNSELYLGISEFLWLYKGADGWYVIKASHGLLAVGELHYGYKAGINDLICQGQLVDRADEPRLWAFAHALGSSIVSDAQWLTSAAIAGAQSDTLMTYYPYKGCFSSGDGSTTFRLPDLRNQFLRGLNNIGSTDTERTYNNPGGIQKDSLRKTVPNDTGVKGLKATGVNTPIATDVNPGQPDILTLYTIEIGGGSQTYPMNAGLLPLIRS